MAQQAEAERERRAKVIHAEGEFQASQKLAEAAEVIEVHPMALQLRYLQTLTEIASEKNSTTIFPVPIDLITPFLEALQRRRHNGPRGADPPRRDCRQSMNPLLFGHNAEERIVGVQPLDDATMRLWVRTEEGVQRVDEPFFPFLFLSDRTPARRVPPQALDQEARRHRFTTSTSASSRNGPPCGTPSATSWTPTTARR